MQVGHLCLHAKSGTIDQRALGIFMSLIVIVGQLHIEDTAYPGQKPVRGMAGGSALYAAMAARLWSDEVGLITRIGQDFPAEYLEDLRRSGIRPEGVKQRTGATMAGRIQYDANGQRTYRMFTAKARRDQLTPQPSDLPEGWMAEAAGFHIATRPPDHQHKWLQAIQGRTAFISLDSELPFIRSERRKFAALLARVQAFFPSEEEARALMPAKDLEEVAEAIASLGPPIVGIKRGSQGIHLYDRRTQSHRKIPALDSEEADITGAGDSFCGGFLAGFVQHGDIWEAGWQGVASASMAIESFGALHLLDRTTEQARKRLAGARGA